MTIKENPLFYDVQYLVIKTKTCLFLIKKLHGSDPFLELKLIL